MPYSSRLKMVLHWLNGFPHALASTLPWVSFLLEGSRKVFAEETADVLSACESISRYAAFAPLFEDRQVTAEA